MLVTQIKDETLEFLTYEEILKLKSEKIKRNQVIQAS